NCPNGWSWKYQASNFTMICYDPTSGGGSNLSNVENVTNKNIANGYAGLDSSSKLTAILSSKIQVPTIDKSQVSTTATWTKTDLPSTTIFTDQSNIFGLFDQLFKDNRFILSQHND